MKANKWIWMVIVLLVSACTATPTPQTIMTSAATVAVPTNTIAPVQPTATQSEAPTQPAPTPEPVATVVIARGEFSLGLEALATDLDRPVHVTHAGDGSGRLFVVEQPGRIRVLENGALLETPFLDITSRVNARANERGLLSVAFHPDYESNGLFYVNYTRDADGATSIERFSVSGDPNVADPNSREVLLTIDQPEPNHNGGMSVFGPDGFLYIGTGDGGGGGDRHGTIGNGQDPNVLLGKMLRLDVASGEVSIWAIGLRNPWRFSFDRETDDLYIADVGQGTYEEVNFQPASSGAGVNYGWRIMEGLHCFNPASDCDQSGLTLPIAEYDHGQGCSVTGGYVYRGSEYAWLNGLYFFADYCSGILWTLERNASGEWDLVERGGVDFSVSSFGEDEQGELYIVGHSDGTVYRIMSTQP